MFILSNRSTHISLLIAQFIFMSTGHITASYYANILLHLNNLQLFRFSWMYRLISTDIHEQENSISTRHESTVSPYCTQLHYNAQNMTTQTSLVRSYNLLILNTNNCFRFSQSRQWESYAPL